jgi:hypothetical protein
VLVVTKGRGGGERRIYVFEFQLPNYNQQDATFDESHPNALGINKINYKIIRQTHLVYLLFIVKLATCFGPAGSSSSIKEKKVMLEYCVHLWDPADVYQWHPKDVRSFLTLLGSHKGLMMTLQGRNM